MTLNEGALLSQLAKNKRVLEIGAYHGRSTICMAQTAEMVHSVDWGRGDWSSGYDWTLEHLTNNLKQFSVIDRVVLHVGRFADVSSVLASGIFDLIFVDAAHDYDAVCLDLQSAKRLIKPNGIFALHDWYYNEIKQAAFDVMGWTGAATVDTLFVNRSK